MLLLASEQEGQYLIIKEDDLLAWGISAQQAFARASLNVGKIATQTEQINLGNDPCFAIRGDSFAAEKALDLGNWFPHLAGRMGALVAFPCTNAAFIVPLPTLRIETVVRLFVGLMDTGYEVYSLAQNGISFRVYWWYDGRFFALPVTRLARGLVFSYVFPHMGPPSEHGENRRFLHEPKGSETEKPDGSRRDRIMSVIHNHDRRLISLLEHNRQGKVICIWGEFNMEHPEEATAVLHRELSD